MKILRIITRLNTGGPAIQAIELNKSLLDKGYDCLLFAGVVPDNEQNDLQQYAKDMLQDKLILSNVLQREIDFEKDKLAFRQLRNLIHNYNPDIIHTHTAKAGILGRLAALSMNNKPILIHTFHGHIFHSYFGFWKSQLFIRIERWLSKRTDRIIAISSQQKKELNQYKIKNIVRINNGFKLDRFLQIEPFIFSPNKILNMAIIGRIAPIKNHDLFIRFAYECAKIMPIKIWVIGTGDRLDIANIENKLFNTGLEFEFLSVSHNEIDQIYKKIDVVVCSSKNEGTPTVLIEAMASGRFVVSTSISGCQDLIGHNYERGIYLNEIEDTAKRLKHYLWSGEYSHTIKRAKKFIAREYQFDSLFKRILVLYRISLMKKERNR